jgi:exopolysaccharide production protein ExoQ
MQAERRSWWGLAPAAIFIAAAGLAGLLGDATVSSAAATGYGFTEDPRRLIVYGLAYAWALMWLLPRAGEALQFAQCTWPLWLLVAYASASMLWSQIPFKVFINSGHYAGETLVALAAVCAARDDLRRLSLMLIGTLGIVVVLSLLAVRLGWPNSIDIESGRWAGTAGNSNVLGLMSAMLLGAATNVFLTRGPWLIRLGSAGLAVAAMLTLRASGSATSLVFALVLTAGTVWLQLGRKDASTGLPARVISGVFLMCLAGGVAIGFLPETFQASTWLGVLGKSDTLTGRTDVWAFGWHMFLQRPFFGYSFDSLASVLGGFSRGVGHLHNGYLDLLVRGGIVAIAIYLFALLRAMYRLLQVTARTPEAAFWFMFLAADLAYELAESSLMRPVHVLWLAFLVAATVAEKDRVLQRAATANDARAPALSPHGSRDRPTVAIPNLLR